MFTAIGGFSFHTFTLYLALAILCSGAIVVLRLRRTIPLRVLGDMFVGALAGGFVLARAEYALLNWDVFAGQPMRVLNMDTGGLDWHGAVIGALFGAYGVKWVYMRFANSSLSLHILDAFSAAVPLIGFAGWTACRWIGCVYGAEVETLAFHPAWMVTEGRDIYGIVLPRYDTHTFGQVLSWGLLAMVGVWWLWEGVMHDTPTRNRFWVVLALFSAGMFIIGGVRADYAPTLARMRIDRWLDLLLLVISLVMIVWQRSIIQRMK